MAAVVPEELSAAQAAVAGTGSAAVPEEALVAVLAADMPAAVVRADTAGTAELTQLLWRRI